MAVRRFTLFATLAVCLALAGSAWAGTETFNGFSVNGQGQLNFNPTMNGGNGVLTIGALGPGGNGALVTNFFNTGGFCGGNCNIVGGYLALKSGPELSGFTGGGIFSYNFGAGGSLQIWGTVPSIINSPSLLFSASFQPGTTFSGSGTVGSFLGQILLSSISLNPALGTYHYTGASNDELSFSISPSCSTGGKCSGLIIQSTTALQTIPEPATLSVLGVGLFTFGAGLRKRMLTR